MPTKTRRTPITKRPAKTSAATKRAAKTNAAKTSAATKRPARRSATTKRAAKTSVAKTSAATKRAVKTNEATKRTARTSAARNRSVAKRSAGDGAIGGREPVRTLTDLEQIRVLADPLRLRIVEMLCEAEFTTKQVAEKLGEKPTKLYHHVDALEKVGLIRLSRTRQKRGTLEKYYIAVARSFRADSSMFAAATPSPRESKAIGSVMSAVFERTAEEMRSIMAAPEDTKEPDDEGILTFLEIGCTQAELERLRRRIHRLVEDVQREDASRAGKKQERRYRLTLAFYPLDRGGKD